MPLRAHFDHIAMDCIDQKGMFDFYTNVLDLEPDKVSPHFPSAHLSNVTVIDFLQSGTKPGLSTGNHFCLNINKEDYAPLKERLEKAGIEVDEPKLKSGAKGRRWSIYVKDPEGNMIELKYYD